MKKYRASILLLLIGIIFSVWHLAASWENFVSDSVAHGEKATLEGFVHDWGREYAAGYPGEFVGLAIELALFAGLLKMFKPYDEDTEHIKELEERIIERFDRLERLNKDIADE